MKTKLKEKKKKEKKGEEKKVLPRSKLGTINAPDQSYTTTSRGTHRWNVEIILLKPFSLELPPARPV